MDPRNIPLTAVLIILSLTVIVFLVVSLFSPTAEAPTALPDHTPQAHSEETDHDEHTHEHGSPYPLQTYVDDLITFQYPAYVTEEADTKGAYAWLTFPHAEVGHPPRGETYLSINRIEVTEATFAEYAANTREWVVNDAAMYDAVETSLDAVAGVPPETEARFAFATGTVNGLPVTFEKSNYSPAAADLYFMTVWLGDGTALQFISSYHDHDILDLSYQSLTLVE